MISLAAGLAALFLAWIAINLSVILYAVLALAITALLTAAVAGVMLCARSLSCAPEMDAGEGKRHG